MSMNAQELPEFNISDTTVTDCDGILYDTGGFGLPYETFEDLTFVISTNGTITIDFMLEFCVETGLDFLYIYDGPNTASPLLATYTGINVGIPGSVSSTGPEITIQFTSDSSVGYCGFCLEWDTTVIPPEPPEISVETPPVCNSNIVPINFSYPIGCEWIVAEDFAFSGDQPFNVESINVICENDSSIITELFLDQNLEYNCNYSVELDIEIPDACDSLWFFSLATSFVYIECPIQSYITSDADSLCAGECATIEAIVEGCFEHSFSWDNGLPPTSGPHVVCPIETTTYIVDITEIVSGNVAQNTFTIEVINADILTPDTTICQSLPAFNLSAFPPDGLWFGAGIQDENSSVFEPDSANAGLNIIYYVVSDFCYDSLLITINPIDAGLASAACPLSPSFELTGLPVGGTWSGMYVDPDGTFDPSVAGSHLVYYELNGCTDSVVVNVDEITAQSVLPIICQSNWADTLEFSPFGGIWSGPGIIDPYYGVIDPQGMDPGDFTLLYEVNGCDQEFTQTVLEINTGQANDNSCPAQASYVPYPEFTPIGGTWEGWGIIDEITGEYDPAQIWEDTWTNLIYYAPNGCSDTIHMYSHTTEIVEDTIFFCAGDEDLFLEWETVGRTPWGGEWLGNGLLNPEGNEWYFSPVAAGIGQHWLTYENNFCSDTLLAIVFPTELAIQSVSLCSNQPQFLIDSGVPDGGWWSGNGIVDPFAGVFDPAEAEPGEFNVYWETSIGCGDSVEFVVEEFFQADLGGLLTSYCYQDTSILLDIYPDWALLTGGDTDSTFNPSLANEGVNMLYLVHEGDLCGSEDSLEVFIYPELIAELTASDLLICPGTSTSLLVEAEGGLPDVLYQYEWSDNLFPTNLNTAIPQVTQYYYVVVSDGCSDSVLDSILIEVLPPINSAVTTSDTLCFGELGWAAADVLDTGNYTIHWGTNPGVFADQIEAIAGSSHLLQITNNDQGCSFDSLILIPNYSAISALFSVNPNADCIAFEENPLSFIDLSQHGISGNWDFGNGSTEPYSPGSNTVVNYSQAGDYEVVLAIVNEGNCPDTARLDLCILPPTPIFIADIFSPNGDGNNDVFYIRGLGIVEMDLMIYDRWGQQVFATKDPLAGWNGTNRGKPMTSGVYVYHVSVVLNNGRRESYQGNFALVR